MGKIRRRQALARGAAWGIAAPALALARAALAIDEPAKINARPLQLQPAGPARRLPARYFGGQIEASFENILGDPRKADAIRQLNFAFTRFPGGSQASFYDWRTGRLNFGIHANASGYRKFWEKASQRINAFFPNGIHYEEYLPFSRSLGLEPIFVPNLETDSVESQSQWMKKLAAEKIAPLYMEMVNEPYLGMLGDPTSMARWPDPATSQRLMRQYAEAFRPYLPAGAKIAMPAADEGFTGLPTSGSAFLRRWASWNQGLANEAWFDAVTIHFYANPLRLLGLTTAPDGPTAGKRIFDALMGRFDRGAEQALGSLAARFPGKEIWVTEWNPRGGEPGDSGLANPVTPAIACQVATRACLAFLRQPAVTASVYFMLNFSPDKNPFGVFVPHGRGGFAPMPVLAALAWFGEAGNGGATYRRLIEPAVEAVSAGSRFADRYAAVEGAVFQSAGGTTLIVQNAAQEARSLTFSGELGRRPPHLVETLSLPDLAERAKKAASPVAMAPADSVTLPPYSVTRAVWSAGRP